ncbi:MAG: preprotein translocase subunit YajC [Verrucomicrobiales bacterium]|jgi:preprotein translocase subunit YajC|nr:preprotein translocase subunit YajC [Verrucomicrobiales bacterium]
MNTVLLNVLSLAQAAPAANGQTPAGASSLLGSPFIMIILMVVVFYFLLIRPQQKRQKEHLKMVNALKTGDKVIAAGGIHGVVSNVKDKTVVIKIAENTKIEIDRSSVAVVLPENES